MGYVSALLAAEEKLKKIDAEAVAHRTGVAWDGEGFTVPWFNTRKPLAAGKDAERILWMHYLCAEGSRAPSGEWVAYRALSGAGFYEPKFRERAVHPLVKRFGCDPSALMDAGVVLGGVPADFGDGAVTLFPLPRIPVTYIVWAGDDELPPDAQILFDRTATDWLCAEDLTVLASMGTYKLMAYQ